MHQNLRKAQQDMHSIVQDLVCIYAKMSEKDTPESLGSHSSINILITLNKPNKRQFTLRGDGSSNESIFVPICIISYSVNLFSFF